MLERGELRRMFFRGAYVAGPVVVRLARETAAVLVCGPAAILSHRSATYVYELLPYPAQPGPVDVTFTGDHVSRHAGIRLHRTATLAPHEIRERHGIPLTAPLRTLIDVASCCTDAELEQAVAEAFALGLTNRNQLLRAVDAAGGRRGIRRLRVLLGGDRRPKRTRSRPERRLLAALRAAGLPEPEANHRVGQWEVDLYWPDHGLVVEVDGYSAHSSPRAFERDRRKDADLTQLGLNVQRFSANAVREDLHATVAWIRRALDRLRRAQPP
jgi:very-short-patch-repair endonuclease